MSRSRGSHKVPFHQVGVDLRSSDIELMQDPLLDEAFLSGGLIIQNVRIRTQEAMNGRTLATASGTKDSSNLSIANLVALKSLLQNFR